MKLPLLLLAALSASTLSADSAGLVSIGVKGGVPLTDALEAARGNDRAYFTNTKRYLVGPTVELHLPARFSVEFDGLYKRANYEFQGPAPLFASSTRGGMWEFPVLGKFELLPGPIRPFADAGVSFRHITGIRQIQQIVEGATLRQVEIDNPPEFNKRNDVGFCFGFGVTLRLGRVRISPEFRYTHWGGETFRDPFNALLRTNRNQGDFLLGLTF